MIRFQKIKRITYSYYRNNLIIRQFYVMKSPMQMIRSFKADYGKLIVYV